MRQEDKRCPFCKSENRDVVFELQKNPGINLLNCNNCYAVSASRMPTDEFLAKYYSCYYDENVKGVTVENTNRFARRIYTKVKELSNRDLLSILDFGGGNGKIAYQVAEKLLILRKKRIDITLVDFNDQMVESETHEITMNNFRDLESIENKTFDLIIASAIIEHIPFPAGSIKKMFNLLKEGGFFYTRTPYALPILKTARFFGVSIDFTYPAHLRDLGPEFWNHVLLKLDIKGCVAVKSKLSPVETSFKENMVRTILAYLLKFPRIFLRRFYKYVGGGEIFIKKERKFDISVNSM